MTSIETLLYNIGKLNNTAHSQTDQILVKTLTTCVQMLQDRACTNLQTCQTMDEIKQKMQEARRVISGTTLCKRTIDVFFHNEERVGVKQLRVWTENRVDDKIIIVSLDGPTAFTRKEAENSCSNVQFFTFTELCVNVTRHVLVPPHEKISFDTLPIEVSSNCAELPILASSDKIAQYYAYEPGDIIRITRTAGTQEPVYYYRIVKNIGNGV